MALGALLALGTAPRSAHASCPATYGTNCNSVCEYKAADDTVECTLNGSGAEVYIVEDYDATPNTYEAWGVSSSSYFCCTFTHSADQNPIDYIEAYGTDYADTMRFTWSGGSYELTNTDADYAISAYIYGNSEDDGIRGSSSSSNNYSEYLYGEDGDDTIAGYGGPDYISGGSGDDTLNGGSGDDEMSGGSGHDEMSGGGQDDTMEGGDDEDRMSGGTGDDDMDGGDAGDVMCGDGHDSGDTLDDGDSNDEGTYVDQLWGDESADTYYCHDGSTKTDDDGPNPPCDNTLTSRPGLCP